MIRYLMSLGVLIVSLNAYAETLAEVNMAWLSKHHNSAEQALSSVKDANFLPTLNTAVAIWLHRDGALTGEISPYLIKAIIADPELTLMALNDAPESFNKWLKQLQGQVFTVVEVSQIEPLTDLKSELESALVAYIMEPKATQIEPAKRMLEKVQEATVYMVD